MMRYDVLNADSLSPLQIHSVTFNRYLFLKSEKKFNESKFFQLKYEDLQFKLFSHQTCLFIEYASSYIYEDTLCLIQPY